jgi:predicted dienelactone hydrolase
MQYLARTNLAAASHPTMSRKDLDFIERYAWAVIGRACMISMLFAWPGFSYATGAAQGKGAPPSYPIGMSFRHFVPKGPYNWRGAQTHALSTVVWYPAGPSAHEKQVEIRGLNIFQLGSAAQDVKVAAEPARFPLIVISHGTGGSGLSMAWLGEALAAHGYVVAAVNHPGNNAAEPYTGEGFSIWWERARDLSEVISGMLADADFGAHIDPKRIGAAGFSLGGYTMIEIAGGITDARTFVQFCDSTKADAICSSPPEFPTLVQEFRKLIQEHPEVLQHSGDSYRDPRVRSVFAMAPALGPAFPASGLKKIPVPVEIVAGESDQNVPIASSAEYFAANVPAAKLHIFPGGVAHYVFLDSCTDSGRETAPTLCIDAKGVDRNAIHAKTVELALDFLRSTLMPDGR